jgi:hypothetical protein
MEHTIRVWAKPAALIIFRALIVVMLRVIFINNVKEKFTSLVKRNSLYNNLHVYIKTSRRRLESNFMEHTWQPSLDQPCGLDLQNLIQL